MLVNVKGAIRPGIVVDNSRAYIRESITSCASQLGPTGKIDQFECARRDRAVPYGDSVRFIAEMAREGVVGGVAVCEASARTIREAAASLEGTGCKIEPPKSNLVSGTRRRCGTACSKRARTLAFPYWLIVGSYMMQR